MYKSYHEEKFEEMLNDIESDLRYGASYIILPNGDPDERYNLTLDDKMFTLELQLVKMKLIGSRIYKENN